MYLGVSNSMREESDTICQVSIYSPLWVDNRTGYDLIFRDLDVPAIFNSLPFLCEYMGLCEETVSTSGSFIIMGESFEWDAILYCCTGCWLWVCHQGMAGSLLGTGHRHAPVA